MIFASHLLTLLCPPSLPSREIISALSKEAGGRRRRGSGTMQEEEGVGGRAE
jgi:hypothetical protein